MTWKETIAKILDPNVYITLDTVRQEREMYKNQLGAKIRAIKTLNNDLGILRSEKEKCLEQLNNSLKSNIDTFLAKEYTQVSKFAYKNKQKTISGKFYSVYPNEMIQPELFLVDKIRKKMGKPLTDFYKRALKVGNYVDDLLIWTSDKEVHDLLDYYSSIPFTILNKAEDCEGHSFLVSSIEPQIGTAFGYYVSQSTGNKTGHAFNVFEYNRKLYILETNSTYDKNNNVRILEYNKQKEYEIHWIFTKDYTYKVADKPVNFGYIDK